jgi:hypothetical protein
MRILFILVASFLLIKTTYSQTFVNRSSNAVTAQDGRFSALNNLYIPRLNDTTLMGGLDTLGAILIVRNTGNVYIRDTNLLGGGHKWSQFLKLGDLPNAFLQGGNSFGDTARLGTNDDYPLQIKRNGQVIFTFIGTPIPSQPSSLTPNGIQIPDGGISLTGVGASPGAFRIPDGLTFSFGGTATGSANNRISTGGGSVAQYTSSEGSNIFSNNSFEPTSGNAIYNWMKLDGSINQTGGANGISRGLHIAIHPLNAADFRAIQTDSGNVLLNTAQGSAAIGLSTNTPLAKLHVVGTGLFTDTLTITTMGTPDSSDRAASTAWVKRQLYGAGGGGGITELTGDGTAGPGSGSQVLTLSTVNSNVGSFTNANITVDGKGRITAASNGTSGNISGSLTAGRVTLSTGANTIGDDAGLTYDAATNKVTTDSVLAVKYRGDTIRVGTVTAPNLKNWWFFGTSITNRFGIADTSNAWINLVASYYGKFVKNRGVNGAVIIKATPLDPFGGQNMIDYMQANLLTKTASDEKLFLAFGENDFNVNSANYTPTAYRLAYDSVVNFAITKGYTLSDIVIVGPGYIDTVTNSTATRLRQIDFNDTLRSFALAKGVLFVDIWAKTFSQNWLYLYRPQAPLTHPGVEGHSLYANLVIETLGDQIIAGGQRAAISDTTELQHVKIRSGDTATTTTRPLGISPSGRLLKYPLNAYIPNDPVNYTNGRIKLNGDIYANTVTPLFTRGGTGNRQTGYSGTAWEIFTLSGVPTMYAFDQTAVAWRQGDFAAANFRWSAQTNTNFQLTMSAGGILESTQNGNTMGYLSVGNSNTGTAASAELRVGPNSTAGNGGRLAYFSTGYTTNGAYAASTAILEAGPTTAIGLNIMASNAAGTIKFFTGGFANGNERGRITNTGEFLINSTTDQGAFTFQNTGGLYQNGSVSLNGTLAAVAPTYVLFKQSDSTIRQLAAVPFANGGTGLTTLGTTLQQLRVNAGATALEYFTPSLSTQNYYLIYSDTTATTVANTTTETTILGNGVGSPSFAGTMLVPGSVITWKGAGALSTAIVAGIPTFTFTIGSVAVSTGVGFTGLTGSLASVGYEYEFEIYQFQTGTNKDCFYKMTVDIVDNGVIKRQTATGLLPTTFSSSGTITCDVTGDWDIADPDNSIVARSNTLEVKLRQ